MKYKIGKLSRRRCNIDNVKYNAKTRSSLSIKIDGKVVKNMICFVGHLDHPHARRPVVIELPNGKVLCVQWRSLTKLIFFNRENIQ